MIYIRYLHRLGKTKSTIIKMSLGCEFNFSAAVRGFHVYRDVWKPYESECLRCEYEPDNLFDIKVCLNDNIVGHLPREISRPTKFLLDRGAQVTATIRSNIIRRSPLFPGGLEVLCTVSIHMPKTVKIQQLTGRFREMAMDLYHEPEEEVIVETFDKIDLYAPPSK